MEAIAFLGAGSMASAMVQGLVAKGAFPASAIACLGGSGTSAPALARAAGIRLATSLEDLLSSASTVVVAFKPQHLAGADPRLAALTQGKLVISVLAGKRLPSLALVFPEARNLVRSMPNTPGQIGAGITGWCAQTAPDPADRAVLDQVFGALGRSVELPEGQMDAFTAICGCGPAYVFEFAAALRDAATGLGFEPRTARTLAIETLLGASRLMARSDEEPEALRNKVTSPNGVTAAGLRRLGEHDFRGMIRETAAAALTRSRELSA